MERREKRRADSKGRPLVNGRPRKTQEELDQEMDDYWENANVGASNNTEKEATAPEQTSQAAPPSNAAAGDDDIDMVE